MADPNAHPPLVLIEWEDSVMNGEWEHLRVDDPLEDQALAIKSVGWLLLDGAEVKVLVPNFSEGGAGAPRQGCGIMTIPTRAVLRIVSLEEAAPLEVVLPVARGDGQKMSE